MVSLIVLLSLLVAMTPFAIDMYLPAMPAIAVDLAAPLTIIQRSLSTFLVGFAVGQLIHGPLSDALGRRPVMLTGIALFTLASCGAALATDASQFLLWRVVQAVGGAAGAVVSAALITDHFKGAAAIKVRSSIVAVVMIAPLIAPSIGAGLLLWSSWRAIYVVLAAYSLLVWCWAWLVIPKSTSGQSSIYPQALLARYIHIVIQPNAWLWFAGLAFGAAPMFAFLAGSPYVYLEYFAISPQSYGLLFVVNALCMAIGSLINIKLAGRVAPLRVLRTVQTIQCCSLLALLVLVYSEQLNLTLMVILVATSVGLNSLVLPNGNQTVLEMFYKNAGSTSALLGAGQFGIGAFASTLVTLGNPQGPYQLITVMAVCGLTSWVLIGFALRANRKNCAH